MLIDEDPETAYRHTLAARARAPRLAVVREAAGEAAYASGHYAEALADLRAAKRMNGATAYLPMMADCHRALGQPEQAVKLAKSPSVAGFPAAAKAEMTIVEAGARRDMGQLDAALRTLELAPLTSKSREPWVVRLRYAYADTLEAAGRDVRRAGVVPPHRRHRRGAADRRRRPRRGDREARQRLSAHRLTGSSRRRGSRRTAWPTAACRGRRPGSARCRRPRAGRRSPRARPRRRRSWWRPRCRRARCRTAPGRWSRPATRRGTGAGVIVDRDGRDGEDLDAADLEGPVEVGVRLEHADVDRPPDRRGGRDDACRRSAAPPGGS